MTDWASLLSGYDVFQTLNAQNPDLFIGAVNSGLILTWYAQFIHSSVLIFDFVWLAFLGSGLAYVLFFGVLFVWILPVFKKATL